MASPTASVIRGGEPVEIVSADVVPGDILILRAGDRVPADARLLEAVNLRADEASLNRELERIFDSDELFARVDFSRKSADQRSLAGPHATGDQNIAPSPDSGGQNLSRFRWPAFGR